MKLYDVMKRKHRKEIRFMTIFEVLKQNIRILEGMRIPAGERNLWDAIQAVLANTRACVSAMEQDRERQEAQAAETPETWEGQAEEIGTGETGN